MSEKEPQINLTVGSQEFYLRRDNSELFHYMGTLAVWNHIFVLDNENDDVKRGTFIPREYIGEEPFDLLAATMIHNEYPSRLNQREVADSDVEIITGILSRDAQKLDTERPEWLDEV